MAINKNHEFEELDGVKCGIVEKNVSPDRVAFLKELLEYNHFKVVAIPSPPPKTAVLPVTKTAEEETGGRVESSIINPETFTIGVTDYTFNTINAIFGRQLKSADGQIVTLAYWQQKENVSHDEVPYYEKK